MVARQPMTVEEFEQMPEDNARYELVRGELRRMAYSGLEHGDATGTLLARLWLHVAERGLGRVFSSETGFRLSPDEETVYMPDIAFVRVEQLAAVADYTKLGRFAPDLVVEVVSPTDRMRDVLAKVDQYLAAGVRLVWVVDLRRRQITAFQPDRLAKVYAEADLLDGADILPDFQLSVASIFA